MITCAWLLLRASWCCLYSKWAEDQAGVVCGRICLAQKAEEAEQTQPRRAGTHSVISVLVEEANILPVMKLSYTDAGSSPSCFTFQPSPLLLCLGRQWKMAQVHGFLGDPDEFADSGPAQLWLLETYREWSSRWTINFCLSFTIILLFQKQWN